MSQSKITGPYSTDLQEGDSLPDSDDVARYCRPGAYKKDGKPSFAAFINALPDISVNRIQFYRGYGKQDAVDHIIEEVRGYMTLNHNGDFVAFNVGSAKEVIRQQNITASIIYTPRDGAVDSSHSSIVVLDEHTMRIIATELAKLITKDGHYSILRYP